MFFGSREIQATKQQQDQDLFSELVQMREPAMNETLMFYGGNRFNVMDYAPVNPNLLLSKDDKAKKRAKRSAIAEIEPGEQLNESKEYMRLVHRDKLQRGETQQQQDSEQDQNQDSKYLEAMELHREIQLIIWDKEKHLTL